MIGMAMIMRSVIASRITWIVSLRSKAIRRAKRECGSSPRLLEAQHVDEHVLEPRLDLAPFEAVARRPRRRLKRRAIHAGDMQRAAEHRRRLDAGRAAQPAGGGVDPLAGRLEGDEAGARR